MMQVLVWTVLSICFVGVQCQNGFCAFVRNKNCDNDPKEPVCATNGVTYENKCAYAKVYCNDQSIHLQTYGACQNSATTKPTTKAPVTQPTTKVSATQPITNKQTQSTQAPVVTDKVTQMLTTTSKPINGSLIALDIFCLDLNYIQCPIGGSPVCGSDGKLYDNGCEFDKQRCYHRDLHPRDSGC